MAQITDLSDEILFSDDFLFPRSVVEEGDEMEAGCQKLDFLVFEKGVRGVDYKEEKLVLDLRELLGNRRGLNLGQRWDFH